MQILIVDDEPLARNALTSILKRRADIEQVDTAGDAIEALDKIIHNSYDVVLLDINMPELSGIALLDRVKEIGRPVPAVIFVTAYEEYAITAFEKHAVDYVLKPFSSARINDAVDVAFRKAAGDQAARSLGPLERRTALLATARIAIKAKGRILFIDPNDVLAVEAQGNYVLFHRTCDSYLLRESISVIADKLKHYGFIRIHRSVLVNSSFVEQIQPWLTGEYGLRIKGGKEYTVTRTYKNNLKALATAWIGTDRFLDQ
jgi:two-component system LytT family response regulator